MDIEIKQRSLQTVNSYRHFARHYHQGPYTHFTHRVIAEYFPSICQTLGIHPKSVLDLACGSGEFAIDLALKGLRVSAIDQSASLLRIARAQAKAAGAGVQFVRADMSAFELPERFDAVTCFFDSLNYLLSVRQLTGAFTCAWQQLNPGGYFIFDMNTIYGLAVLWQRFPVIIQQETDDYLEVAQNTCDYENLIASMRLIMFEKNGDKWDRYEELHRERGYALEDVLLLLERVGFETQFIFGDPLNQRPLAEKDGRMWIAARRRS